MTAEKLEEMARQMEESIKQMENNNLLSEQVLEKMLELQKLFNEIATPEMKEAMKKMAEALKEMSQEELEKAMEEFQMTQEEMLQRLERSVDLLKRMQIQQKMTAMEESLTEENSSRLAQREKQLQKQMSALKKEADKLDSLLSDSPYKDSQGHARFSEAVKENQASDNMQQMEQALSDTEQDMALDQGQEASLKLQDMVGELQQLMADLSSDEGQKLAEEIRKAIDDTNYLSEKQENLHNACEGNIYRLPKLSEAAAQQEILRQSVDGLMSRVDELSRQSPFLAAEIRSYLEEGIKNMSGSCNSLGKGSKRGSLGSQRDAVYNLNQASIKLLDGLENQKQCNKGGSCNKKNQKMQSMCQKQSQINKECKGQCPKPGQKLSQGQRDALKRLAGEQGTVRKSLQELQAEFGNRREILGRLDALAEEARQIEEMLEEGQVGDELFNRQLRIYSRMLDVQKSLNRRDFSRERKAVSADDILRASPGPLEDDGLRKSETLQDRLNRYLQEGYPRQYEQQIKAYFKAISNMGQNQNDN
jgi:hypothetical protein